MAVTYPELVYRYPTALDSPVTSTQPQILLDWSNDIVALQASSSGIISNYFLLLNEQGVKISLSFVSYTSSNRRLILTPTNPLNAGETYRVLIKRGVLDTYGRKSINDYNWTFTIAPGILGQVTLNEPGNESILNIWPELSWEALVSTGTVTYSVQVDRYPDFQSVLYQSATSSTSITPLGSFPINLTYYWRVVGLTAGATGMWSETRSFFYGSVFEAHQTSDQSYTEADLFGVDRIGFVNGASNIKEFPSNISITFTSTPVSSFADYITVKRKAQLPRNDDTTTYDESLVSGTWTLTNNTITFDPTETIKENYRYTIEIDRTLVNILGQELGEDYSYYWSSRYHPYYVDIRVIKARLRSESLTLPDDLINFQIYQASLEAKSRYYATNIGGITINSALLSPLGDTLTENQIRDTQDLKSYGTLKWVEVATTYNILNSILIDELRNVGRSRKLGDYSDSLTADFVKAMELALNQVKEELDQWEDYLAPSDIPRVAARHSLWTPYEYKWDFSVKDVEAWRGGI